MNFYFYFAHLLVNVLKYPFNTGKDDIYCNDLLLVLSVSLVHNSKMVWICRNLEHWTFLLYWKYFILILPWQLKGKCNICSDIQEFPFSSNANCFHFTLFDPLILMHNYILNTTQISQLAASHTNHSEREPFDIRLGEPHSYSVITRKFGKSKNPIA